MNTDKIEIVDMSRLSSTGKIMRLSSRWDSPDTVSTSVSTGVSTNITNNVSNGVPNNVTIDLTEPRMETKTESSMSEQDRDDLVEVISSLTDKESIKTIKTFIKEKAVAYGPMTVAVLVWVLMSLPTTLLALDMVKH